MALAGAASPAVPGAPPRRPAAFEPVDGKENDGGPHLGPVADKGLVYLIPPPAQRGQAGGGDENAYQGAQAQVAWVAPVDSQAPLGGKEQGPGDLRPNPQGSRRQAGIHNQIHRAGAQAETKADRIATPGILAA